MVEWLAVVAFCVGEKCAFWSSSEKLLKTEAECRQVLGQAEAYFRGQGVSGLLSGCIPLKMIKI